MYPKEKHVQLLDACIKKSIFDSGSRRHVELWTVVTGYHRGRDKRADNWRRQKQTETVTESFALYSRCSPLTHVAMFYWLSATSFVVVSTAKQQRSLGSSGQAMLNGCLLEFVCQGPRTDCRTSWQLVRAMACNVTLWNLEVLSYWITQQCLLPSYTGERTPP